MEFSAHDTAFVVIDPQNDVLSEKGVAWALVGKGSVRSELSSTKPALRCC